MVTECYTWRYRLCGTQLSTVKCLTIEQFADASVDLIYLDPPFDSNATYSLICHSSDGKFAQSQIEAFEDTWQHVFFVPAENLVFLVHLTGGPDGSVQVMRAESDGPYAFAKA